MLKVCMILPKGLPVPNVKGGAIESLVTEIIKHNEIYKKLDLTVFSVYDKEALIESKKYKYTKFYYIKNNFKYKLYALIVRIKNLLKNSFNTYNEVILSKIKNKNFDYIVIEDGAYSLFSSYLKYFSKDKMVLHFHHCGTSDKLTDKTYSTFLGVSKYVTQKFKKSSSIPNCITIRNGIDLNKFKSELAEDEKLFLRKQLGLTAADFVVLYCGRLVKEKGVLELIRAIKNINNDRIKLMIVGSINFGKTQTSDYLEELNKEISSSNNKVIATGYVKYAEVYKYFKISDIAVFPTLIEEAALLVNIESMASGIPAIITNTGGALEYSSDETIVISKDNVVENIEEKVLYLYKNKSKREKMIAAGIKKAGLYSSEKMYLDFVEIIEKK